MLHNIVDVYAKALERPLLLAPRIISPPIHPIAIFSFLSSYTPTRLFNSTPVALYELPEPIKIMYVEDEENETCLKISRERTREGDIYTKCERKLASQKASKGDKEDKGFSMVRQVLSQPLCREPDTVP